MHAGRRARRFGRRISEEELLLRLTMPAEQVDAMLAAAGARSSSAWPITPAGRRSWISFANSSSGPESPTWSCWGEETVVWRRGD